MSTLATNTNAPQRGSSASNVLHRALDELDLLSLQLRTDVSTSGESSANWLSHSHQSGSLRTSLRNRSHQLTIRNVCDRLGLSPPSSPSPNRRTDPTQISNGSNCVRQEANHGKHSGGSHAFDILDLEIGRRRHACAKTLGNWCRQRSVAESQSKFYQSDVSESSSSSSVLVSGNNSIAYTPFGDRRSRKRLERCKRLRKPYDLPWRAQKSATLNTLFSDFDRVQSIRGVSIEATTATAAAVATSATNSYSATNSQIRRVSAPSVLDTDDECTTPTQSLPNGVGTGAVSSTRLQLQSNSRSIEPVVETPTPTGNIQGGPFAERVETLMINSQTQTQTQTSDLQSLGLLTAVTVPGCEIFTNYDSFVTNRSQSNSIDSKSPVASGIALALAPSSAASQSLSRSRSLDTVGIGEGGAYVIDSNGATYVNHYHSSHASYVSQTHSPQPQTAYANALNADAATATATATATSQLSSANMFTTQTQTFAYPAPMQTGQQQQAAVTSQGHTYTYFWRTAGGSGANEAQTSAGALGLIAPRPASLHNQQALQKYGVEDMMAHSLRHLRLNDR